MRYELISALVNHLTTEMQTNVPTSDPTRADVVKAGFLFHQNPTRATSNVYITVSFGRPDDDKAKDGIASLSTFPDVAARFGRYAREVGGGEVWFRRITVRFGLFFVRSSFSEDQALQYASQFMERLENALASWKPSGIVSSSGKERALWAYLYSSSIFESGGERAQSFMFRGEADILVATERSP